MRKNPVNTNLVRTAVPERKRAKRGVTVRLEPTMQAGCGCTDLDDTGKTRSITLSAQVSTFRCIDRTVPLHELLHTRHTKPATKAERGEFTQDVLNAVEDMAVHGFYLPWNTLSEAQKRDWIAGALLDLRTSARLFAMGQHNAACYAIPRAFAVLRRSPSRYFTRGHGLIPKRLHPILDQMITALSGRKPNRPVACRLYRAMLEPEKRDEDEKPREPQLTPEVSGGAKIDLVRLPLTSSCDTEKPRVSVGSQGAVLHPGAMIRARLMGKLTFIRVRKIEPQGTVLIDASGSMRPDIDRLTRLCRAVPGATIIYYNGRGSGARTHGQITIFAEHGRRADSVPFSSLAHGGNSIDAEAMELAFQYGAPYTLVSDCHFIGGVDGGVTIANAYVDAGRFAKIHASLDEAIAEYERTAKV